MDKNELTRKEIGLRLRKAREMAGLSQAQAAKILELHRPTLTEIELGNRKVPAEELSVFASTYDVGVTWLLGEVDDLDLSPEIQLAARGLSRLKDEDLKNVLNIIKSIPSKSDS